MAAAQEPARPRAFFRRTGITFNVYGEDDAEERLIPFDMVPRIITGGEWRRLSRGIEQRVRALNAFMHDLYHRQEIIRVGPPARAAVPRQHRLAAADGRLHPAGRGLHPHRRHRPGAHRARRVLGAGGQRPHAQSGVSLHAREPRDDDGDVPRAVHAGAGASRSRDYPRRLARSLAACAPDGDRRASRRSRC